MTQQAAAALVPEHLAAASGKSAEPGTPPARAEGVAAMTAPGHLERLTLQDANTGVRRLLPSLAGFSFTAVAGRLAARALYGEILGRRRAGSASSFSV